MEIQVKPAMTVLSHTVRTTMKELANQGMIVGELLREVMESGMHLSGCNYWIYTGCEDMDAEFDLEIAFPVMPMGQQPGKFTLRKTEPLKCVTTIHQGPYSEFQEVYPKLMDEMTKAGLEYSGTAREVYINCDFEDQNNCITEIQIGVK